MPQLGSGWGVLFVVSCHQTLLPNQVCLEWVIGLEKSMFVKMITYDSEYGDATQFDEFMLSVDTYDKLNTSVLDRYAELIRNRTLLIDSFDGSAHVVDTRSGNAAETYLLAYPSARDLEIDMNGLLLADGIFYDPDTQGISCGMEACSFWEQFCELVTFPRSLRH